MPGSGFPWEQKTPPNFMIIDIPENAEHINILMSGGADSTLLAYLVSKQTKLPIILHTLSPPDEVYQRVIIPVFQYLQSRFNKHYHLSDIRKQSFFIRDAAEYVLSVYPGVVLTGCNKVVTHFTPSVYIRGDTPPIRGDVSTPHHLRPFLHLDKVEIFRIYQQENILDLLSLTRSCGMPGTSRCGGCYFCMERAWAADVLGIIDINNTESQTISREPS